MTPDDRDPLPDTTVTRWNALLDAEIATRLPGGPVVVEPDMLSVAVPLSGQATEDGFGVLPRGTRSPVTGEVLRFFTYWRQRAERTDFDLSALLFDAEFNSLGHVSWTGYENSGVRYSGDLTEAPDGAAEFIEVPLADVAATYVVPQVNVYSGEGFDQVAESMFGWMTRDRDQHGAPFEARTVRTRSDLRGSGRVALPVMFGRDPDGAWSATWTHLYLNGSIAFNRVEGNKVSTGMLARSVYRRRCLTVGHLVALLRGPVVEWDGGPLPAEPVTLLGPDRPAGLADGSRVVGPTRLDQLWL